MTTDNNKVRCGRCHQTLRIGSSQMYSTAEGFIYCGRCDYRIGKGLGKTLVFDGTDSEVRIKEEG